MRDGTARENHPKLPHFTHVLVMWQMQNGAQHPQTLKDPSHKVTHYIKVETRNLTKSKLLSAEDSIQNRAQ